MNSGLCLSQRIVDRAKCCLGPWIRRPSLAIEHMEVDLVFSRLSDKRHLHIMDIGSHRGEFLDIFEYHNHSHTYDVMSIEPMSENARILRQKIRNYKRVHATICEVAIPDVNGPRAFYQGTASTLFTCTEEWRERFPEHFQEPKEVIDQCITVAELLRHLEIDAAKPFDFI